MFAFRWAVCQHCALPQRDQPVPSGGAAGSPMEAVQQRGDPNLPEQSIPTWRLFFFFFGSHTPFVFVWHYSVMQSQSITCHFRWLEAEATFDSSKRKLKELVLSFSPSSSSPSLIPQNDYVQFKFNDLSDPQKNDLSLAHTSMLHLQ